MTNQSQKEIIINHLNKYGYVSRNWALRNYISRLGAITCDLNKEGWILKGSYEKTDFGQDFIYRVKKQDTLKI